MNEPDTKQKLKKAFTILRRNYGCPGPDSISLKEIRHNYLSHEAIILAKLKNGDFGSAEAHSRTTITDYMGNQREIYVYSVYERWIQEYLKIVIEPILLPKLGPQVFGYRRGIDEYDAYSYILSSSPQSVMYLDIEKFYSSISTSHLGKILQEIGVSALIVGQVVKAINTEQGGAPAGNVLSPLLANIYLTPFDQLFQTGYARFSDDMYFWGYENEFQRSKLLETIIAELASLSLRLNTTKTQIINNPTKETLHTL